MQIEIYKNFSKRKNSTKRPNVSTAELINAELKADTNIENPSFILARNDFEINYIKAMGNYYFVDNIIILNNNRCEYICTMDDLATHKTEILSNKVYVMYATNGDDSLVDNRIQRVSEPTINTNTVSFRSDLVRSTPQVFTYMVTVVGINGCYTYATTYNQLAGLMPNIDTEWSQFVSAESPEDAIFSVGKQIIGSGSISENIRDVRAIPFSALVGDMVSTIKIGYYTAPMVGTRLRHSDKLATETKEINIPWAFSDWRNLNSTIYLYIPFVGTVSYPAHELYGQTKLNVTSCLYRPTGEFTVIVKTGDEKEILGTYGANTGSPIPMGNNQMSTASIVNNITSGIASGLKKDYLGAIQSGIDALKPNHMSIGGIGNTAGVGLDVYLKCTVVVNDTVDAPGTYKSIQGVPLGKVVTLSTLSGFVQTQNASVNIAGRDSERNAINQALNSGIYIE